MRNNLKRPHCVSRFLPLFSFPRFRGAARCFLVSVSKVLLICTSSLEEMLEATVFLFQTVMPLFTIKLFAWQTDLRIDLGWTWCWRAFVDASKKGIHPPFGFFVMKMAANLTFDPDDMNDFNAFGCYFQNFAAKIVIGKGSYIAPNVGLVTANHVLTDLEQHQPGKDIVLGKNCWIGMNSTVLPGVVLGDHTVVGAGSVVTKSFPEGWQVIAGNPAKVIRKLEKPTENENQNKTIV